MEQASILIVEDELIVAESIAQTLEGFGYAVCGTVSAGAEALAAARDARPDLVLMDIVLKGEMDGIEAADRIRTLYAIPVVFLTAHADAATLGRAKVTEPYGYILKPFHDRDLSTAIEMALYKHQAEKKIQRAERMLALTLKSIGDGVIATDGERRITFMNRVAEELTGWSAEEAMGRPLSEVLHIKDEDIAALEHHLVTSVIRDGLIINLGEDRILVARDGREVPISDSVAPIRDEAGDVPGVILVFRDITKQKQAEEALKESHAQLKETYRLANIGIWKWDVIQDRVSWSEELCRIVGWDTEASPPTYLEHPRLYTPESWARLSDAVGEALEQGTHYELELEMVRPDGERRCTYTLSLIHI